MNDNAPTTENTPETEKRRPLAEAVWFVSFLIGFVTLVLTIYITENKFMGRWDYNDDLLTVVIPFLIGIPATLLSVVQALIYRLFRFPVSMMMLPVYFLVIGCVMIALFWAGKMVFRIEGSPLVSILGVPLLIGIPATVWSIKSAFVRRPSRLHISLMLLLAHVLVFALNFVVGVIACC